jgi:two-component system NtrC family sensor kinase
MENDLRQNETDQIHDVLRRMSRDGTLAALFDTEGKLWMAQPIFPHALVPAIQEFDLANSAHFVEFERWIGGRRWFCRLVPLSVSGRPAGYLLVSQDWTDISEDLRDRSIGSIAAAILVMALIAGIIPLAVRHYISNPLSELSRRVTRLSDEHDGDDRGLAGDEVELLTEEFRRLDQQLTQAGADLLERHRREIELVHRLQHADRLATIGTLASGLAHEIGTPMGVIRARAEYLLHSRPTSAKINEGLEIIVKQIDRISGIVRMLLNYARGSEPVRTACDVRRIVEHALSLVETEAARRRVHLTADLGERPLTAECDSDQLQQVFINLAVNAFDAMDPDGGTLRVFAEVSGINHERHARIIFADTGPGVAPQLRSRVFDPFFTTKAPGEGTGLGLEIARTRVRGNGGVLDFDSRPGRTEFRVCLPLPEDGATDGQAPATGASPVSVNAVAGSEV